MYVTLVAAAALLLAGCGKKQPAERQKVVTVKTMKVAPALETVTRNYVGTIEAEEGVNVSFNNIGTVARVLVYEGQSVSKGQALAELDGRNIRNAYAMSKATLDQAEDAYRRMKNLYDKGTLPEIRMVEMESNLQRARSAEAISHKSLEDIVLRAPWSGYVGTVNIHEGANVTPGVSGIHLVKIDRVKVGISIPEDEFAILESEAFISDSENRTIGACRAEPQHVGAIINSRPREYVACKVDTVRLVYSQREPLRQVP